MIASFIKGSPEPMIISCPACSSRYRVADEKIQGRGARITCPTCKHKFAVYRSEGRLVVGDADRPLGVPVTIARKGELVRGGPNHEEEEAPTTLMPHGSSVQDPIRPPARETAPTLSPAAAQQAVPPPPQQLPAPRP
ncbi:MAG TPA: zinc-ribbon domain-containing protein, partial [Myxococcota bacterium]|nr:zinc-ribbon domain-containing protein [Myxococcota bacterium]